MLCMETFIFFLLSGIPGRTKELLPICITNCNNDISYSYWDRVVSVNSDLELEDLDLNLNFEIYLLLWLKSSVLCLIFFSVSYFDSVNEDIYITLHILQLAYKGKHKIWYM